MHKKVTRNTQLTKRRSALRRAPRSPSSLVFVSLLLIILPLSLSLSLSLSPCRLCPIRVIVSDCERFLLSKSTYGLKIGSNNLYSAADLKVVSGRLTIQEKIDVINLIGAGMDRKQIQEMFGIKAYHIKDILKRKDRILAYHQSGNDLDKFAVRYASFPTIDAEVGRWLREMTKQGITLDGKAIKAKAMQVAADQGIHDFKASYCWITKMKKRQLGGPSTPPPPPVQQQHHQHQSSSQQQQQHHAVASSSGSRGNNQRSSNYNAHTNNNSSVEQLYTANNTNSGNVNLNLINMNGNNAACLLQGQNRQVTEPTTFIFSPSWFAASMGIYYQSNSPSTEVRIQPAHQQARNQVAYPTNPRVY